MNVCTHIYNTLHQFHRYNVSVLKLNIIYYIYIIYILLWLPDSSRSSIWQVRVRGRSNPNNLLKKKSMQASDWSARIFRQPHNIGVNVEQSYWAALLAAAVQLTYRHTGMTPDLSSISLEATPSICNYSLMHINLQSNHFVIESKNIKFCQLCQQS